MVTKKIEATRPDEADAVLATAYARRDMNREVPKYRFPDHEMSSDTAYNIIHDELMLDGNSRLNLATFVTTWMEPQAEKLMAESLRQEHDRQGRVSADGRDRRTLRQHRLAALQRARGGRRRLDHRFQRGGDAGRHGAEVALARAPPRRGQADRQAQPDPGLQRPGRVGEVLPLLGRRAQVHPDGEGTLRDHAGGGRAS